MGHPEFRLEDVIGTNFDVLDEKVVQNTGGITEEHGWTKSNVPILIPTGKKQTKATKCDAAARQCQQNTFFDGDDQPPVEMERHIAG